MTRKLNTEKLALAIFIITLVSTLSAVIYMQSYYHSSYLIYASKLDVKPDADYFVYDNPDVYALEAISTQNFVTIGSPEDTQLDDLLKTKGTSYFEYNGNYYGAGFMFETKMSPVYSFLVIFSVTAVPAVSIVAVVALLKRRFTIKKSRVF